MPLPSVKRTLRHPSRALIAFFPPRRRSTKWSPWLCATWPSRVDHASATGNRRGVAWRWNVGNDAPDEQAPGSGPFSREQRWREAARLMRASRLATGKCSSLLCLTPAAAGPGPVGKIVRRNVYESVMYQAYEEHRRSVSWQEERRCQRHCSCWFWEVCWWRVCCW